MSPRGFQQLLDCLSSESWLFGFMGLGSRVWMDKTGHPTVAARKFAPPAMYKTTWKHIKTHKKVAYTVEPIHWCRISSNNMAMATLKCIIWAALRAAGVNRGETHQKSNSSRLKFQYFSVTNSRLQSECHQLPVIQNFQELQVTAATLHHFAWLYVTQRRYQCRQHNPPSILGENLSESHPAWDRRWIVEFEFPKKYLIHCIDVVVLHNSGTSSLESVGWLGSPGNVNCHLHPLMSFGLQLDWDSSNHRVWRRPWTYNRKCIRLTMDYCCHCNPFISGPFRLA